MTGSGKIVYFPDMAAIEAEAAAWVARFDGGPLSAGETVQFQEWVSQSAAHRDAIIQYGGLWSEFDNLRTLTAASKREPDAFADARRPFWNGASRRWFAAALAASLVGVIVLGATYWERATPPPVTVFYDTAVGAQRNITLPDGSTVTLNTDSRIAVAMSAERRDVHLERGEAYFEVTHDERRPFSVFAGKGVVRDIGTAFDVRLLSRAVDVSVISGSIEVSARTSQVGPAGETEAPLGVIRAGRAVTFDEKIERSQQISNVDMNRKLAWRQGVLIYAGEPLERMADDIDRYAGIKVEFADPKLRARLVGGSFKISQIDAAFVALKDNFGIESAWLDAKHVRLSSSRTNHLRRN
jgi:transmembrane sensor